MSFQSKLKALKEEERLNRERNANVYSPEYKERIWTIMIACGGALENQDPYRPEEEWPSWRYGGERFGSYYGSNIDLDVKLTEEVIPDLIEGVDWDACSDPAQIKEYRFNGTFTSTQLQIEFLVGTLVTKSGRTVWWGTMLDGDIETSFGNLIKTITRLDVTMDEAIEELAVRVNRDKRHFSYSSCLPLI